MRSTTLGNGGSGRSRTSAVVALTFLAGCGAFGPDTEEVLLPVAALATPATVMAGDAFEVSVEGVTLSDGCVSFDRVTRDDEGTRVELRVMGRRRLDDGCIDMVTVLDPIPVEIPARSTAGQVAIVVIRPAGGDLTGYVEVQ